MPRAIHSAAALQDYREIWNYIADHDLNAADRLLVELHRKTVFLARHPHAGRSRANLLSGMRSFPVGSFLIFYLPVADGIEVLRVLHAARDFPSVFPNEGA